MTAFKLKGMDERYEPFRPVAVASRTRTLDARVHETTADRFSLPYICSMNQPLRYMDELFRIVNGALRLDTEKVRNYAAFLAEKLEQAGEENTAKRLRKLLEETDHNLKPVGAVNRKALPVDEESRFPLVERDEFRKRAIMVLNNETTMMKTERPDNPIRASINFDPARKSRSCTIVVDALPARLRGGG